MVIRVSSACLNNGAPVARYGHMRDTHKMTEMRSIESLNFIGHCLAVEEEDMEKTDEDESLFRETSAQVLG